MMSEEELRQEMRQYIRYITGRKPSEHALQLFVRANEQPTFILDHEEENQLRQILPHPILIPLIDCATGLFLPNHFLRKRMTLAFAIIETDTAYVDLFMPRPFRIYGFAQLAFRGTTAVFKAIIGRLVLWKIA
jgi:hypothetical protein